MSGDGWLNSPDPNDVNMNSEENKILNIHETWIAIIEYTLLAPHCDNGMFFLKGVMAYVSRIQSRPYYTSLSSVKKVFPTIKYHGFWKQGQTAHWSGLAVSSLDYERHADNY